MTRSDAPLPPADLAMMSDAIQVHSHKFDLTDEERTIVAEHVFTLYMENVRDLDTIVDRLDVWQRLRK